MQNTFLEELAQSLFNKLGKDISSYSVIFPNRRAGLFFNHALRKLIDQPIWAPETMAIEDFVRQKSDFAVPDQLSLVFSLHEVFQKHAPFKEDFEQFYFWGDMLVKDFNDVDHYMADARPLFANLLEWKKLADTDFLSEEQLQLIEKFWKSFEAKPKDAQEKFSRNWNILYPVYQDFRKKLKAEKQAYNGMLYRDYADKLKSGQAKISSQLIFAGFNALTKTEEIIISEAVKEGAEVYWDMDAYYASPENSMQEAGNFFREYAKHSVLGKTFPPKMPNRILEKTPEIKITEIKGNIAQAKFLGQLLSQQALEQPEKTAIILGDESLLFPVLYALPESIHKVNVTMGYPLRFASIYQLMNICLYLQKNKREEANKLSFNHRDVLRILKHPFVGNILGEEVKNKIQQIDTNNIIRLELKDLYFENEMQNQLLDIVFKDGSANYFHYLKTILQYVHSEQIESTEQEFIAEIYKQIDQLEQIVSEFKLQLDNNAFIRLFNRIVQSIRVPFSGEPLEGIQIMGVLESRNLDFEHIYFLSISEDNFPGGANNQSFIPYNIRKAYGLPTLEQRDAIYAYLFNRLLQRSQQIHLMYNSDNSGGKGGEPSRYLLQLQYELGIQSQKVELQRLNQDPQAASPVPITIEKNKAIRAVLKSYNADKFLSASALKIYLDCRLQFYFRYIAGLKERDEVSEDLDAADFGNILHHVMEKLYGVVLGEVLDVNRIYLLKKNIDHLIIEEFAELYGKKNNISAFEFEGRNIIIRDVVKRMVVQILNYDAKMAPFTVKKVEGEYGYAVPLENGDKIRLQGSIDRLDEKEDSVRVIDYKSGGDEVKFPDVESLFDRDDNKRNGAAMQTLIYSYLFIKNQEYDGVKNVVPGLYNGKGLFKSDFSEKLKLAGKELNNAEILMEDFEKGLKEILSEIFISDQAFNQTDKLEKCTYCPYKTICNR
ncbi:PD-(D/E)XK nuclease superfamily protein [Marivirga sericea]|uniref:PD-(D/E)XK nuclease superfamily protein n=1 Tax=Marivirga sericea TaxID=1028 RepID=A0A1X7JMT2_9BACT|nr:PD-(D/E)XK nuclease family protein [Marivirga sericea]SMG29530.1 PD-(D/E)XK nuclease superfamily protein [Marivirga sericea]